MLKRVNEVIKEILKVIEMINQIIKEKRIMKYIAGRKKRVVEREERVEMEILDEGE